MDPMKYDLSELKRSDVRTYKPGELLVVYEWYCDSCDERIGYPYIDETHAEICDDATECPKSVEWNDSPCGHVVCKWCHEPASEHIIKWTDEKEVETIADKISLEQEVSFL